MDHHTHTNTTRSADAPKTDDVLCRLTTVELLDMISAYPKPLEQIGFTGIVLPEGVDGDTDSLQQRGLGVFRENVLEGALDLAIFTSDLSVSAIDVWSQLESSVPTTMGVDISIGDRSHEAMTLLQMSTKLIPLVPVNQNLLYSSRFREQRELLRSAVFWRKRFEISRHTPKLVHAGDDGLLIYSVDSWLVSINQNPDEASIDLGTHGSMWLMLGTQREVHLHGSMLILPAFSGAIVANELAR